MNRFCITLLGFLLILAAGCQKVEPIQPSLDDQLRSEVNGELQTTDRNLTLEEIEAILSGASKKSNVVVPAGSVDAISAAIAQAGKNGIVILASGNHSESGPVVISKKISILGQPGAVVNMNTTLSDLVPPNFDHYLLEPGFHIRNTQHVTIYGIDFQNPGQDGNTAVLIENADHVDVLNNTFGAFQFGVLVEDGDHCEISGNTLTGLASAPLVDYHGIQLVNGSHAKINNNTISNYFFGIWACGDHGKSNGNVTNGNIVGFILCNVPADVYKLPNGTRFGAQYSASYWRVENNVMNNNGLTGLMCIDGSHDNQMKNNNASGNPYDIYVVGDSYLFNFFTPAAYDNQVIIGPYTSMTVKDCAINTQWIGTANFVDNNVDPCI